MRWHVRLGSATVAWMALAQAFYAGWLIADPRVEDAELITKAPPVLASTLALVALAEIALLRRVSATRTYSDEREYICAAWLCVGFGVALMIVEGVLAGALDQEKDYTLFLFEEALFGIGAIFALLEEHRQHRRSVNPDNA